MRASNTDKQGNQGIYIQSGAVVLPCVELDPNLAFFTEVLDFSVELIYPADRPRVAVLSGYGLRLRLEVGVDAALPLLRLEGERVEQQSSSEGELVAPNGTRIELVDADPPIELPAVQQSYVLTALGADDDWVTGRAGMRYRDLIPGRQGGRFIASHIQISDGGPVPDYVHYHRIRFQMIYCYKGWVRVVYEDQGEPFLLQAGDCVLQPPQIRHRVLESSAGLEVIEIGCPAEHETYADHKIELPTPTLRPERDFGGQRFVRHIAADAHWDRWRVPGFMARNTGIEIATGGLASVQVVRPNGAPPSWRECHNQEFLFLFLLSGSLTIDSEQQGSNTLAAGSACVIPGGLQYTLDTCSKDLEFLEVSLPAFSEGSESA